MIIKKSMILLFAGVLAFAIAACAGTASQSQSQTSASQSANTASGSENASGATGATADTAKSSVSGASLEQLNLGDGEAPIIRGVGLDGNRAGTSEISDYMVNSRALSSENIRSVFELNEWISVRLDTDVKSGISGVIVPHQESLSAFADGFADNIPDEAPRFDLNAPEDAEEDMPSWGSVYLHVDYWKPGNYDLVFMSGNKAIARIQLSFYKEYELESKTDAQLNDLMKK